jgi:hypothetical protein
MGRPGQMKVIGTVLGAVGLFAIALLAESRGYGGPAYVVILGALAIGVVYAIKSRSAANRS